MPQRSATRGSYFAPPDNSLDLLLHNKDSPKFWIQSTRGSLLEEKLLSVPFGKNRKGFCKLELFKSLSCLCLNKSTSALESHIYSTEVTIAA